MDTFSPDLVTAVQDLLALLTTKRVDPESADFTIVHGLIAAAIQVSEKLAAKTEEIIRSRSPSPMCHRVGRTQAQNCSRKVPIAPIAPRIVSPDHDNILSDHDKILSDSDKMGADHEPSFSEIRAKCICTNINWSNSLAAYMEIERVLQAAAQMDYGIWMQCDPQYDHIVNLFANSHRVYRFDNIVCIK